MKGFFKSYQLLVDMMH